MVGFEDVKEFLDVYGDRDAGTSLGGSCEEGVTSRSGSAV